MYVFWFGRTAKNVLLAVATSRTCCDNSCCLRIEKRIFRCIELIFLLRYVAVVAELWPYGAIRRNPFAFCQPFCGVNYPLSFSSLHKEFTMCCKLSFV
ncbi:unnamed protein product [Lathyrus sativus]|nr:unnamed protein product [Lathyrus sativus]